MLQERISVLVVDDNADHLELVGRRLRDTGYDATLVDSGEEALRNLDDVDLVLLDYRLPGMSGIDILKRIRAAGGPSVVMVTGMGSETTVVEAMRAGAIDYVVKEPGYVAALPQLVERAWRHHDLERRARELQRLTLLVTSATERADVLGEIVRGARRLLRATACALFVRRDGVPRIEAQDGAPMSDEGALAQGAAQLLADPAGMDTLLEARRLLVRLPASGGEQAGVLAMLVDGAGLHPEEVALAETFASFAGIALEQLHRRELEQQLLEELQRMLELRQDVVASVSHELRTPLTCILGFSETLLDRWLSIAEGDRRRFVEKMEHHALELFQLVEGLLDYAALESGRFTTERTDVDLAEHVRATLTDLSPILTGRPVEISVPEVRVRADPALLRRSISNLVSNAAKYSPSGMPVVVRATTEGARVRVEVTDRGIGLGAADQTHVFEPFWRARTVTAQAMRGAGVGLALVKEYVRLMDGTIGVRSEPGAGSTFWFTVPLAADA